MRKVGVIHTSRNIPFYQLHTDNVNANLPRTTELFKLKISHDVDAAKTCRAAVWNTGKYKDRTVGR